jgi:hypothetical protein
MVTEHKAYNEFYVYFLTNIINYYWLLKEYIIFFDIYVFTEEMDIMSLN